MNSLSEQQSQALQILRARIDPEHPGFAGSEQVKESLSGPHMRLYIESWLLPLIDAVEEKTYPSQAHYIEADAKKVGLRILRSEAAPDLLLNLRRQVDAFDCAVKMIQPERIGALAGTLKARRLSNHREEALDAIAKAEGRQRLPNGEAE